MVKCLTHGLRGFNGAVQRRLATLKVTMLTLHEFVKKNMVRYMRPHERFAHCSFWPLVSKYTISQFFVVWFLLLIFSINDVINTIFSIVKSNSQLYIFLNMFSGVCLYHRIRIWNKKIQICQIENREKFKIGPRRIESMKMIGLWKIDLSLLFCFLISLFWWNKNFEIFTSEFLE